MKKIITVLLIFAMVACMGCGSSNVASKTNVETTAAEKKRPVSATLSTGVNTYSVSFNYNDDGTYVANIQSDGGYSYKYYFASNGCACRYEEYDKNGTLSSTQYFVNGVAPSGYDRIGFAFGTHEQIAAIWNNYVKLDYDANGAITNVNTISEKDEYAGKTTYAPSRSFSEAENVSVERDDSGKIIKTSDSKNYTLYSYTDDTIVMKYYTISKRNYNECNWAIKEELNSNGAVNKMYFYNGDCDNNIAEFEYQYTYDENGFVTKISEYYMLGNSWSTYFDVEYVY